VMFRATVDKVARQPEAQVYGCSLLFECCETNRVRHRVTRESTAQLNHGRAIRWTAARHSARDSCLVNCLLFIAQASFQLSSSCSSQSLKSWPVARARAWQKGDVSWLGLCLPTQRLPIFGPLLLAGPHVGGKLRSVSHN